VVVNCGWLCIMALRSVQHAVQPLGALYLTAQHYNQQ